MGRVRSGDDYLKAAKKNGFSVEPGKGDHFKVYAPNGDMMTVPLKKELARGTEHSICKWFLKFGIVVGVCLGILNSLGLL